MQLNSITLKEFTKSHFVVHVDTNSEIDPVHVLKSCFSRLVQNVN
jgi:hypothetical protein